MPSRKRLFNLAQLNSLNVNCNTLHLLFTLIVFQANLTSCKLPSSYFSFLFRLFVVILISDLVLFSYLKLKTVIVIDSWDLSVLVMLESLMWTFWFWPMTSSSKSLITWELEEYFLSVRSHSAFLLSAKTDHTPHYILKTIVIIVDI